MYGISHLGPKNLYRDNTNLTPKLKTQTHRRKFRAGLKGNIDFLNQLNIFDFEDCLKIGSVEYKNLQPEEPLFTSEQKAKLKEMSPIELIKLVNEEKANKMLEIFHRIKAFAHFSQSLTDYFANDDALEPALAVVCQLLRQNENIGTVLKDRHTTFLGLAQPFQKLRSPRDRDFEVENKEIITSSNNMNRGYFSSSDRKPTSRAGRKKRNKRKFCYVFQKRSSCRKRNCAFSHKCANCRSKNHGEDDCRYRNQ